MQKKLFIFVLVILVLTLGACSTKDDSIVAENHKSEPTEQTNEAIENDEIEDESDMEDVIEAPNPPENTQSLITYTPGMFAGIFYDENETAIEEELSKLPPLKEEEHEDEVKKYWAKLISLFAEDYPDPNEVVENWKKEDFGNPDIGDPRYEFKENYNVEIILDASGSMAEVIDGKSMMDWAKESIKTFSSNLPKEANVALRVYGHKGTGSDSDKKLSCASSELLYEMQAFEEAKINDALNQFQPSGWTPIAESLIQAKNDFAKFNGDKNTNIIYLVSDGVETCDGDPVKEAKELAESSVTPILNVIGFNVDSEGQKELKKIAEAADGTYQTVRNVEQLQAEFDRSQEMATKWLEWKVNAESQNIDTVLKREETIFEYKNEFAEKSSLEIRNLDNAVLFLYKNDQISSEQRAMFKTLRHARYDLTNQAENEMYNDLLKLAQESYKEIEKEINEKYKHGS
ncbi:VWA domain-containing protein [Lederbergia panacisoli]|uniref:VWA domain-containing protein n=1 Tax=Lederbergia panacisoli TaxID=1255251 RepID=UPI00214B6824|nr:VWA domain-containing protein [Lederbergia panacisoli]MCR2823705.1 VWA domain-containing protein [Lederbergia panacisoli]